MTVSTSNEPVINHRLLDRLVDGELGEAQRAELLQSLSAEPDGWKRCAMAFLEAQAWGGALSAPRQAIHHGQPARPLRFVRQFAAVAASVVVAFMAGFVARGVSAPRPDVARRDVLTVTPHASVSAAAIAAREQSTLPDYVRRQLERQGYEVEGDRKTVSVALKDGRQLAVPVETYKYRFVGHRLY